MSSSAFEAAYGFPRSEVRLDNWHQAPWNVWALRHIPELIPTARIAATPALTDQDPVSATDLAAEQVSIGTEKTSIVDILQRTSTDALVVMKSGRIVADFHAPNFTLQTRHLMFSATKSVTATIAGILHGDGLLDPDEMVPHYVPELGSSAYAKARVRDLLDMRVSLDFDEAYTNPLGIYSRYRRAGLWQPSAPGIAPESLIAFLASLQKGAGDHGTDFHYASPNSDVLGLVIERATGQRYADVMSARLWRPLEARQDACITVDIAGSVRAGGGMCMTPRDLARFGEMMRLGGTAYGRRIVPEAWVRDTLTGGAAKAWGESSFAEWLPAGRYRNKWFQTGAASGAFFALGIHGQWLYIDPKAEMVAVKFSSQPVPSDTEMKRLNLGLFSALAEVAS